MYEKNMFLTLTYDEEHLMSDSLIPEDFTLFMKRLRRKINYYYGTDKQIRFFGCGEYGAEYQRPHFHIIIFDFWPDDAQLFSQNFNGDRLYTSRFIESCWGSGFAPFGTVSFESCAYVARYVTKKITGPIAEYVYDGLQPEFVRMSRRPGIGAPWLDQFRNDVYPNDYIVIRDGVKVKPPRYFDNQLEKIDAELLASLKDKRKHTGIESLVHDLELRDLLPKFDFGSNPLHSFVDQCLMAHEYSVIPVSEEVLTKKSQMLVRSLEEDAKKCSCSGRQKT